MDFTALENQLDELEARYTDWRKPIQQTWAENIKRVNRDGYTLQELRREMDEIEQQQLANYDPNKAARPLLEELCAFYLTATQDEQSTIRTMVSQHQGISPALLYGYIRGCTERIQATRDETLLRLGLAAAAIENCSSDYRDVLIILADLAVAAEEAGIDFKPHFAAVSELASAEKPRGGNTSMKDTLANFHSYGYAVLKERREQGKPYSQLLAEPYPRPSKKSPKLAQHDQAQKEIEKSEDNSLIKLWRTFSNYLGKFLNK